ncbi:MAG: hypothetical protein MUQ25_00220 [Candidatus Aminicenantes bacterium]|nr:hypothetical protein [Candidatus Aminicenantes bacterium]
MKNRITRRRFLEQVAKAAGGATLGTLPLIQARCKGTTEPEPPPPPPGHDVTVTIEFYNHTQGPLGEKQYPGISNGGFSLDIGQLGFNGVYPMRIAVRKADNVENMGSLVGFSKTGSINLKYPENNESWEAYLMNFRANTYELFDDDEQSFGCKLNGPRNITWRRQDFGSTGPDEPVLEAVRQINEALNYPWKKYGSLTQSSGGDLQIGYDINPYLDPYNLSWEDHWITIDPTRLTTYESRLGTFITTIFEYLTITGLRVVNAQMTDEATGNLTPFGKDMMGYFYVKDAVY